MASKQPIDYFADFSHVGIASIGLHFPPLALPIVELAKLRNVDPDKYLIGLGCKEMALCPEDYTVVELATVAAKRALSRWQGENKNIGMIAVGTESAVDMSRPLSAWVAANLGLKGAIRSYEAKHACYGGTLALRQAIEWKLAGIAGQKAALVIAVDEALYEQQDPGEPTQGAGAVAMIIDDPVIAHVEPFSYPWSEPVFDFYRPVGCAYPIVDGKFSLECYCQAVKACYQALINGRDPEKVLAEFHALCFHVPFPKMVKKALASLGKLLNWDEEKINNLFKQKVDPTMDWNRLCGNAYTASLWIAVANTLKNLDQDKRIAAFSYGSGFGSELLTLSAGPAAAQGAWAKDVEEDIKQRHYISAADYQALRKRKTKTII